MQSTRRYLHVGSAALRGMSTVSNQPLEVPKRRQLMSVSRTLRLGELPRTLSDSEPTPPRTILAFQSPSCNDCSASQRRLESNATLSSSSASLYLWSSLCRTILFHRPAQTTKNFALMCRDFDVGTRLLYTTNRRPFSSDFGVACVGIAGQQTRQWHSNHSHQ